MIYTNKDNIPLPLAVLLATDTYAHNNNPKSISATTLLQSTRQIVLGLRAKEASLYSSTDINERVDSALGTAIHNSLESAWIHNYAQAMASLGQPKKLIDRIVINPPEPTEGLDIYLERRTEKELDGYSITGAFDLCIDGIPYDLKTTKVYSYIKKTNDAAYIKQLSIYRWLNQSIITGDYGIILYWFKDWLDRDAKKEGYPPQKLMEYKVKLLSLKETEELIRGVIREVTKQVNVDSNDLPLCSDEELWINAEDTVYKYYKDPSKTARATKNFKTFFEANERHIADGSKGLIKEFLPPAKKCGYCSVRDSCNQYASLVAQGRV